MMVAFIYAVSQLANVFLKMIRTHPPTTPLTHITTPLTYVWDPQLYI